MRMQPKKSNVQEAVTSRTEAEPLNAERRELAARYMPLALSTARKFSSGWGWIRDEMESAALVALVDAARTFDPSRNVHFPTFLRKRLFGALLDTRRQMCQSFARFDPIDMGDDDFAEFVRTKSHSNLSPDEVLDFDERIVGNSEDRDEIPLCEVHDSLRAEFRTLPQRHREVMDGIYIRHLSFDDLAISLRCSKTRLIAVHRESLDLLLNRRPDSGERSKGRRTRRGADPAFPDKTKPKRDTI